MKVKVDVFFRACIQKATDELGNYRGAQRAQQGHVDTPFPGTGHLELVDAGIQHAKRLFHIGEESLPALGEDNIASFLLKELDSEFFFQ